MTKLTPSAQNGFPHAAEPAKGDGEPVSRTPAQPQEATQWKRIGGLIGTLLGASVLGTALNLWYQGEYVPSTLPPQILVTADLTRVEDAGAAKVPGIQAFQATIKVVNPGKRRVAVLAASLNLYGEKIAARSSPGWDAMLEDFKFCGNRYASMGTTMNEAPILASGRFLDQSWIDPGQEAVERPLLYVPDQGFDALYLAIDVLIAKGDLVQLTDYNAIPWPAGEPVGGEYCSPGFAGDLNGSVIYGTEWRVVDRTPVIGGLRDTIAVEWRSMGMSGRKGDGSGPCEVTSGDNSCQSVYTVGEPQAGDWMEPMIAICDSQDQCRPYLTMTTDERWGLAEKYGLSRTGTIVETSLWH